MVVFAQLRHSRFWYGAGVKRAMVRGSCGALLPEGSHRTSLCSASTKEAGLVAGCAPQAAPSPRGRSWRRSDPVSGTAVQAGWLYCCLKLKFKGRSSKLQDVCVSHWDGGSSSGAERARHWGMSWRKLDLGTSCLPNCWSSIEGFQVHGFAQFGKQLPCPLPPWAEVQRSSRSPGLLSLPSHCLYLWHLMRLWACLLSDLLQSNLCGGAGWEGNLPFASASNFLLFIL